MSYIKRNKEYWKNYRRNRRELAKAKSLIKANGDSFVGEDEPIIRSKRKSRYEALEARVALIEAEIWWK